MDDNGSNESAWSTLDTITTFDASSTSVSTNQINQIDGQLIQQNMFSRGLLIESLMQILCKILEKDPKQQNLLYELMCGKLNEMNLLDENYQLQALDTIRTQYQINLFELISKTRSLNFNKKEIGFHQNELQLLKPDKIIFISQYAANFDEIAYIAKGGFGKVFKVRNKVDREEYAMKKIFIKYINKVNLLSKINEVTILARLNHVNIVYYKTAFFELVNPQDIQLSDNSTSDEYDDTEGESSSLKVSRIQTSPQECAILYIQMQLCDKTLREWITLRNENENCINKLINNTIFQQICCGVAYIHSQNIVHHDLKPSNIFINHDSSHVQVGDFGLACTLNNDKEFQVIPHDCKLGTELYTAPEQLNGRCDFKSDIYTLGIILFELYQIFGTQMERMKLIGELKKNLSFPKEFELYLDIKDLIKKIMNVNPLKRPSAQDIYYSFNSNSSLEKDELIKKLYKEISEKDKLIESLNEKIRQLESKV